MYKRQVPFSEISEEEIAAYTLGEGYTTGHEFRSEGSGEEVPGLAKTSSENTNEFEIVHQKQDEKNSSVVSERAD